MICVITLPRAWSARRATEHRARPARHSSIAMSLRYAHLAPDQRRDAVAKLNDTPIFTPTMRLRWDSEPTDVLPIDFDNGKGGTRIVRHPQLNQQLDDFSRPLSPESPPESP